MDQECALRLIEQTVKDGFPELQFRRMRVFFEEKQDYYMACLHLYFGYLIHVDKRILRFSERAFIGCLAHELAHLVDLKRKSIWQLIRNHRNGSETEEERAADLLAIERGFGEALLQFHEEHNRDYKSYKSSEGLTKKEIKRLLKK